MAALTGTHKTITCPICHYQLLLMPINLAKAFEEGEEVVDNLQIHCPGRDIYHSLEYVGEAPRFFGVMLPKIDGQN